MITEFADDFGLLKTEREFSKKDIAKLLTKSTNNEVDYETDQQKYSAEELEKLSKFNYIKNFIIRNSVPVSLVC